MTLNRFSISYLLISTGLFGIALYFLTSYFSLPVTLNNDLLRGVWFGVCIGLEICGLILLGKSRHKCA